MPIAHAIWKVGAPPVALSPARLASEQELEEMIVADPGILSSEWMLIGQQEVTSHGGRIDLLAIAPDGSLVLVELKRGRTPRELIALELSRFSGRVNTEVFSLSPPLGRGKLPPRSGGVKGGVRSQRSFMRRLHVGGSARS